MADVSVRTTWALCCGECGMVQYRDKAGPTAKGQRIEFDAACGCLRVRARMLHPLSYTPMPLTMDDLCWLPKVEATWPIRST